MKKLNLISAVLVALCMIFSLNPAFAADTAKQSISASQAMEMININSADVETLSQLPGIGQKTAEKIVSHRKANGNFTSPEELMNVKGIGQKKFDKMKALLKV